MKAWTVDPEIVRKVRDHILSRESGPDGIVDFDAVGDRVQSLADLLIVDAPKVRASILDDVAFSVRLGACRKEAARRAYRHLVPAAVRERVSEERYVEHRTAVASLTASVDGLLGFYDPIADRVCLRAMPADRVIEIALREELRRFFRRDLPQPHRLLAEGPGEATSMEYAMANIVLRRYYDPIVQPRGHAFPQDERRTWADVFGDDDDARRIFAGAASKQFLSALPQHYDFTSREHLDRIEAFYLEGLDVLVGPSPVLDS